jgi:flavin-dependent dehydrogenase
VIAKEAEFRLDARDAGRISDAPELFFCRDLEGYGWCVRKGNYLNVGIGRRESEDFGRHVNEFVAYLGASRALAQPAEVAWRGHAYLASGSGPRPLVGAGMLAIGDAAGLAYPESGEGICPAIESGRLAAQTLIAAGSRSPIAAADLQPYADAIRRLHPPASATPARLRGTVAAIGRALLGSRTFTRHVVLDRWFLRQAGQAPAQRPSRSTMPFPSTH